MTTLNALTRPRLLLSAGPIRRGFFIGFLVTLAVGLMLLVGASVGVGVTHTNRVMPGVSVGGVPLGGLDRTSATAQLEALLPSLTDGSLVLSVDGDSLEVPLADLGRSYDLDVTVDAAMSVARNGNPLSDGLGRLQLLAHPTPLSGAIVVQDPAAIDGLVSSIVARFDRPSVDASVTYHAASGFDATPAVTGLKVDQDALRQALKLGGTTAPASDAVLDVAVLREAPAVSTLDATAAASAATSISARRLRLTGTREVLAFDKKALAGLITFGPTDDGHWGVIVDSAALRDLLKPIAKQVSTEPRNASFVFGANGVVGFIAGEPGRRLKLNPSVASVLAALEQRAAGVVTKSAALSVGVEQPVVSTKEAQAVAPRMRQISSWTTWYDPGEGNFWGANISIPAQDLDGMVIAPGEWFDFWKDIGPVTVERGYGYGGVIIGGRSVANGALAGGICSTSTTLFNAAMRAGLEIGQKVNHSYYIERYPVGLDATVLKTDTYTTSMQFRNDTDNPIMIRSYTGTGFVRFDIWGIPNGRTVTLSTPVKRNYGIAVWTTVVNGNLAPGTSIIREYPHNGFDTSVTRWVRDADGNIVHQDTWNSHYNTVNGVTEVGPRRTSG
ncbi:MAG: VanW family protein [Chloroflexota bacterium]